MGKQRTALIILLISSFLLSTIAVPTVLGADDFWDTMADMPTGRLGPGVAAVNGRIYVIGGYGQAALDINEEYDPVTDTWTTKTNMPTARSYFAIAVYQNKIYCIGGEETLALKKLLE